MFRNGRTVTTNTASSVLPSPPPVTASEASDRVSFIHWHARSFARSLKLTD